MADTTLYPTADTWIDEGAPDANKGGLTYKWIQTIDTPRNFRVFIKFDLSSLPEGVYITLAKLRIYCYFVNDPHAPDTDVQARRVADDGWEELVITWANQPDYGDVEDWKTPAVGWVEWDITDFVQAELAGDEVVSLCLRCVTESYDGTARRSGYYSKEYDGSDPELYIEYSIPTAHEVTITDIVGMVDTVPKRARGQKITITDVMGASDSVGTKAAFHLTFSDIVGMLDSAARSKGIALTISDIVGIRDRIVTRKRRWPLGDLPDDTIQGGA